jgi:hypothetical protein
VSRWTRSQLVGIHTVPPANGPLPRLFPGFGSDAARLSLHQNTLRYRLRRANELFGIDLDNPDDTLTLWLSLRVVEFD